MSFIGKKYSKVDLDNAVPFFAQLTLSDAVLKMLRQEGSVTTFVKNGDGSYTYLVKAGDNVVLDYKFQSGQEGDFTTPDGVVVKANFTVVGEEIKSYLKFPDGKIIRMDRKFEGNKMTMVLSLDGASEKATITYETV